MSKPLHKDISFWTVAIVLAGAANVAQFSFAVPWFKQRRSESKPAPRNVTGNAQPMQAFRPDLDFSKKSHPWQKPQPDAQILANTPAQVVIIPTEYFSPSGGWSIAQNNQAIGIRVGAGEILQNAYGLSRSRMVLPPDMPRGQYDFIANLPSGAMEALREEIRNKLSLIAERETRSTNVLLLTLHNTNAPGLKSDGTLDTPAAPSQPIRMNSTIASLANYLEAILRRPVIDVSGLTGTFDIRLPFPQPTSGQPFDRLQRTKELLVEHLGLQLIETNAPLEMLVVRKVEASRTARQSTTP
jgi:uncharacterized protein (TIGR03435 family)